MELFLPKEIAAIKEEINAGGRIGIAGCADASKAHIMAVAANGAPIVCICSGIQNAKRMSDDLGFFVRDSACLYPTDEMAVYDVYAQSKELLHEQAGVLGEIESRPAVVIPFEALMRPCSPKNDYNRNILRIKEGDDYELDELVSHLVSCGYSRVDVVLGVAQFSVRGGILDVYPPGGDPTRIEFYDELCDSIRTFSIDTQVSVGRVDEVAIVPAVLESGIGMVLEYINKDAIIFIDEPNRCEEFSEGVIKKFADDLKRLVNGGVCINERNSRRYSFEQVMDYVKDRCVVGLYHIMRARASIQWQKVFNIVSKTLPPYKSRIDFLLSDISEWADNGYSMLIAAGNQARCKQIADILDNNGYRSAIVNQLEQKPPKGIIRIFEGGLSGGIEYPETKSAIISASELFHKTDARRRESVDPQKVIKSYSELSVYDYVVHQSHGVGRYMGLSKIRVGSADKDYLKIQYKGSDVLYVPVSQMNVLHKYAGSEPGTTAPGLNKLGGQEWQKTTKRAKKNIEDIAATLLNLYAARAKKAGHSFSNDTVWQQEFEQTFPYQETEDQIRAINETKKDMESARPMDRLICGDVGFGKTEIAIRAAFKCVMDGMQCAYLVPTTILCSQHYSTFIQRMADYPVKIEMLSRFKTGKERDDIKDKLRKGEIDIIISTHAILGKNIAFKNLGLLIIDEEQRFGVTHKERIKELKQNIDVLTLTATPIPRTLHMALIGIRDMSLLNVPPKDRFPVITYVIEYNELIVRDAINKEIARGGQVFYVHNRVETIHEVYSKVMEMVPDARVSVAHGQMPEKQLEKVMLNLLEGKLDILVCTTIIETGLDIPTVNTLIIEDADKMGLSQLYQIRGRVGRSNRQGYAYFTFRPNKMLSEEAEKRLVAIKEFTELGAGFKISKRDLEIRGAGDVLGSAQHGFVDTIGYDLYVKMLEESISKLKGDDVRKNQDVLIDVNVNAYIPSYYIESHNVRIEVYKKVAGIENINDKEQIIDELIDRFGAVPNQLITLMDIALLKGDASKAGISEISQHGNKISLFLDGSENNLQGVAEKYCNQVKFVETPRPHILWHITEQNDKELLSKIKIMLKDLQNERE